MDLPARLREIVGDAQVVTDPDVVAPYAQDWTRRWAGKPLAVVRPGTVDEVAAVVRACAEAEVPQGSKSSARLGGWCGCHDRIPCADRFGSRTGSSAGFRKLRLE